VVYHLHPGDIFLHPSGLELVLLSLRLEVMDGVLHLIHVAMAQRRDGLPGGVSHNITDRFSEGWPLVPAEDLGPREDLYDGFEFQTPWAWDSLDLVSWGEGDAQVSQQSTKPTGGDWSYSTEGFPLVSISVQFLALVVTQGRVPLVISIFTVDIMALLLLLLLSRCALGRWAPRYHQLDLKRLLLPRCALQ
jgi:hypothetical protein